MITGIDLGSRYVKIVVFNNNKIIKLKKYDTTYFYRNFTKISNSSLKVDYSSLDIPSENICSTGYGRNNINLKGSIPINELKAHVWGVKYQLSLQDFTLIDIGGQDVKIIKVVNGYIEDFVMNDKCAASTGRFLENMANLLNVDLEYISNKFENPVVLNSTCAIFGETEIIGKIAEGVSLDAICASINFTLAKRIANMAKNIFIPPLVISGGVSKNRAMVNFLKNNLKTDTLLIPEKAQFNGAIGCIYYFLKVIRKQS